jgi:hypothetical protein
MGIYALCLLNLLVVIKLIKMAPHTMLENIQLPPTMHGIVFLTIYGPMHGATNEPMAFMLKDQIQ